MFRPKKCRTCSKKTGGIQDCPDGLVFNPATGECEIPNIGGQTQYYQTGFKDDGFGQKQAIGYNPMDASYADAQKAEQFVSRGSNSLPTHKFDPTRTAAAMQMVTAGLSNMAGRVERGRQNKYDYLQQTALGQMNLMPTTDYQPNPYSLYAKYGGKMKHFQIGGLKHAQYIGPASSNDAHMKMDKKEMGGLHKDYDFVHEMMVRNVIPHLMKMGTMSTKNFKGGGLTPNDARQILHDGTAQGHPLTDKQRRFFGAKSKGHTNYRGK